MILKNVVVGARLMMIVKFVCVIRIPEVYPLLRVPDYRLCLRNLLVLVLVALLTFLLTDQGLVPRFGCLMLQLISYVLGVVLMFLPCALLSLFFEIQDLKKKEKELQAKEAELKRREQV